MYITPNARAKILRITEPGKFFRINAGDGGVLNLIPNGEPDPFDVTITNTPLIVADIATATLFALRTLDFDYSANEFIMSKR